MSRRPVLAVVWCARIGRTPECSRINQQGAPGALGFGVVWVMGFDVCGFGAPVA
jgi:hypothetical protein